MLGAFIGKGLSAGAKEGYSANFTEEAKARRAEAKAVKEQRNQQLEQMQATKPSEEDYANMKTVQSQELELLKQQNKQAIAQNAQMLTYQGFDRFVDADYDPRLLNSMLGDLKRNPIAGPMYKDFIRVDKVTEQDKGLLTQAGLDAELIINNPALAKQFVKTTRADGSARIDDITQLMKQTGYYKYARQQELARQTEAAKVYNDYVQYGARTENERIAVRKALSQGLQPGTPEFESIVATETERLKREFPSGRQTGKPGSAEYEYRTKDEREALRRTQNNTGLQPGDPGFEDAYNETYADIVRRDRETAVGKQEAQVDNAIARIGNIDAENNIDFFSSPEVLTDPKIRAKYEREIEKIERFGDLRLDAAEKKELRDISVLIGLGDPASEITPEETGIIDSMLRGAKKYVSDEVGGTKATSSYAAFRNATRHALYGAALTEAEIRSFNQAFGTLGQQLGPVLQQFTTSLNQVKSKLESIESMNNSYVTRFRLGMSQEQLQSTINAVNQRLEYINRISSGSIDPVKTELSNEEFQEMDALYQEFLNEN